MKRRTIFSSIAMAIAIAACAPPAPPPAPAPAEPVSTTQLRYLIDPRAGFDHMASQAVEKRFDAAWHLLVAGDFAGARKRLDEVVQRDATYAPARLAEAAIDIMENRIAAAKTIVERQLARTPNYLAAKVYDAEIAIAENKIAYAYDTYRAIAALPKAPQTANERVEELGKQMFEQYYAMAQAASPDESVRLLRQALAIEPAARPARMLLVQKLIASRRFDEAHAELQPLLATDAGKDDVQDALAEIDAGSGKYQEAIVRLERLARRTNDPRYQQRLDQLKSQFASANMPLQFQRAFENPSITRADLAVLMYWKVSSIRFAQNLGAPPIAIDIGEIPGRDEVIRAIALGIYTVDPVTRRVGPGSPVNAGSLARVAARILILRGAGCVRQAESAPGDVMRAQNVLKACGIADPTAGGIDAPVSGRDAAAVMEQIDLALSR